MNKHIKKILNITLSMLLSSSLLFINNTSVAKASTVDNAKGTLLTYLNSLEKSDTKSAINISSDSRFSEVDYETQLSAILQNPNERISSYDILSETNVTNSSKIILTKIKYLNGKIDQIPFKLEKLNSKWKVIIDSNLSKDVKFKTLTTGTQIPYNSNATSNFSEKGIIIHTDSQMTTWNYNCTRLAQCTYSNQHFNMSSARILINLKQWGDSSVPSFRYSIVHIGLFYETTYASDDEFGTYKQHSLQRYLYPSSSGDDITIKITRIGISETTHELAYTLGEVYQ